jgi:hypothetical protein
MGPAYCHSIFVDGARASCRWMDAWGTRHSYRLLILKEKRKPGNLTKDSGGLRVAATDLGCHGTRAELRRSNFACAKILSIKGGIHAC